MHLMYLACLQKKKMNTWTVEKERILSMTSSLQTKLHRKIRLYVRTARAQEMKRIPGLTLQLRVNVQWQRTVLVCQKSEMEGQIA